MAGPGQNQCLWHWWQGQGWWPQSSCFQKGEVRLTEETLCTAVRVVHSADSSIQEAECLVDIQRAALSSHSCSLDAGVLRPLAGRNRSWLTQARRSPLDEYPGTKSMRPAPDRQALSHLVRKGPAGVDVCQLCGPPCVRAGQRPQRASNCPSAAVSQRSPSYRMCPVGCGVPTLGTEGGAGEITETLSFWIRICKWILQSHNLPVRW